MKASLLFSLLLLLISPLYSQGNFMVGLQGGRSSLIPETVLVPNQMSGFNARGAGGVHMLVYGRYHFQPNLSVRLGGGIIGYRSAHTHTSVPQTRTSFRGVQPQLMASLDYQLLFEKAILVLYFRQA